MGWNVSLIGSDLKKKDWKRYREPIDAALAEIAKQNSAASEFKLGSRKVLKFWDYDAKIGKTYPVLGYYAAHLEHTSEPPVRSFLEEKPVDPRLVPGPSLDVEMFVEHLEKHLSPPISPRDRYPLHKLKDFRHLICHDLLERFYFPIDFPDPIYPYPGNDFWSMAIGSSNRLLTELEKINAHLKVVSEPLPTPDDLEDLPEDEPWRAEKMAWGIFYWHARQSVAHNLIITCG